MHSQVAQSAPRRALRPTGRRWVRSHPVVTVAVVALLARLCLIAALQVTVGGSVFLDDSTYVQLAADRAAGDVDGWGPYEFFLYDVTATFLVPLTALYRAFGPSVVLGQLLAAAFATAAAAATTRAALTVLPASWSIGAGLVVAVLPSQVFFSSLVLKDAAVWAVLAGTATVMALLSRSRGLALLPLLTVLAALLWMLGNLRLHTLVAASCAAALAGLIGSVPRRPARAAGVLAVCILVPLLAGIGPLGLGLVRDAAGTLESRRSANAAQASTAFVPGPVEPSQAPVPAPDEAPRTVTPRVPVATDATPPTVVAEAEPSLARDLRALPRGLRVLLLDPLPGQADGNDRVRLALLENLLWWPLVALALVGTVLCRGRVRVLAFPVLCAGAILVLYALTEGNFGTAYRHRGEVVWAVALLAASGAHALVLRTRTAAAAPSEDDQPAPDRTAVTDADQRPARIDLTDGARSGQPAHVVDLTEPTSPVAASAGASVAPVPATDPDPKP